jgi:hypothetical protein
MIHLSVSDADMRKAAVAVLISALLFSAVAGTLMVSFAEANPYEFKPEYCYIFIQSPKNGTFNTQPVLLNFTVKNNYWSDLTYFYTLDGQYPRSDAWVKEVQIVGNETISNYTGFLQYVEYTSWGHTVLPNLSEGSHELTLTAVVGTDWRGSTTVYFSVAEEQQPEPFPITLVIAAFVTVIVLGAGLLVYFKKRKS